MYKCKYFKIQELVCNHMYSQYGDRCWEFLDENFLISLDKFREIVGAPLTINNYSYNGTYKESGKRCPLCHEIKKHNNNGKCGMSAHIASNAADIKCKTKTPSELCKIALDNQAILTGFKRIEDLSATPTWFHVDSRGHHKGIKIFKP
ncbi:MAG: hypothetical protein ACRCX2_18035 [Paraclostridium sp.]